MKQSNGFRKFVGIWDAHFGFERRNHHKLPIHNPRAIAALAAFLEDFKPHDIVYGGDILDCGSISHHNKGNRRAIEGLRLREDSQMASEFITHATSCLSPGGTQTYIKGNHEDWIQDLIDDYPALEGVLEVETLLPLKDFKIVEQGEAHRLGKLWFIHGDQFKGGGSNVAKKAVEVYGRNIRLGHFHKYEAYTKHSALDAKDVKTGVSVPSLCTRGPGYAKGAPNQWSNGFLVGYMLPDGNFTDQVVMVVDGKFVFNGKQYKG